MKNKMTAQVTVAPHVLVRELDGEAVLLDLDSEEYFGLDPVGTRMWTVLTTASSVAEAITTLTQEYDVTREELATDLQELLQNLLEKGLISVKPVETV